MKQSKKSEKGIKRTIKDKSYKKETLLIILIAIIILGIFLIKNFNQTGKAIDPTNLEDPLGIGVTPDTIPETPEEARETATIYLKQEWAKIMSNSNDPIIKALWTINQFFHAINPLFKLFIGVEYAFSWFFFLNFGVWISIVLIIFFSLKEPLQFKWWVSLSIAIIITAIGTQTGAISQIIMFFSPIFTSKLALWLIIILLIFLVYLYEILMKNLGKSIREKQKIEDEERRERKAETVENINDIKIKAAT